METGSTFQVPSIMPWEPTRLQDSALLLTILLNSRTITSQASYSIKIYLLWCNTELKSRNCSIAKYSMLLLTLMIGLVPIQMKKTALRLITALTLISDKCTHKYSQRKNSLQMLRFKTRAKSTKSSTQLTCLAKLENTAKFLKRTAHYKSLMRIPISWVSVKKLRSFVCSKPKPFKTSFNTDGTFMDKGSISWVSQWIACTFLLW